MVRPSAMVLKAISIPVAMTRQAGPHQAEGVVLAMSASCGVRLCSAWLARLAW